MSNEKMPHPMQPLEPDEHGVLRFRRNKIVDYLLEWSRPRGMGLNELRAVGFDDDEWQQFAQLIGYSLSGWGTLSFVSDAEWDNAQAALATQRQAEPVEDGDYYSEEADDIAKSRARAADEVTDAQREALWKRWSISPCEDGWHQQPEAYRMKAAFMAGLAAMQKDTQ
jgi:hypothetical protein